MNLGFIADKDHQALASKLNLIQRQSYVAYLAVPVNSLFYVFFTWQEDFRVGSIVWAFILNLFNLMRYAVVWKIERSTQERTLEQLQRRHLMFFLGSGVSGVFWGVVGWHYYESATAMAQSFALFLLAGMTAGAVGAYSASLPLLFAYLLPALLPFVVRSFLSNDPMHISMGTVGFLYLVLMIKLGINMHTTIIEAMNLHLQIDMLEAERKAAARLLANVSHELRTPLAAINGYADLLQSELQTSHQDPEAVAVIKRSSEHLMSIVEDLLDFSQLHTGKMQLNCTWFSPTKEIKNVVQLIRFRNKNNITIDVKTVPPLPEHIYSDPKIFRQIVINLLTNALKFTPSGRIEISLRRIDTNDKKTLSIDVSDTGIGIEPSLIPMLFQPFSRGRSTYVQNLRGSGLGLALSKELAGLLGGDLQLKATQMNRGSTFSFFISANLGHPALSGVEPSDAQIVRSDEDWHQRLKGLTVLIVDDSADLLSLLKRILSRFGIAVTVCNNGAEAIARIKKATFDIILMDLTMPVLDGFDAIKLMRKSGYLKPIIALTAHATEEHRGKCREAGFNDFLIKPINQAALLNTVFRWSMRGELIPL